MTPVIIIYLSLLSDSLYNYGDENRWFNKLAEKIVEYRNLNNGFKSIDELDNVDGIGKKKIEFIRPFISLD